MSLSRNAGRVTGRRFPSVAVGRTFVSARGRLRRTAHRDGVELALVRPAVEIRPTSPQHPSTVLIAETHPQLSEMIEPAPDRTKPTRLDQSDEYEWVSIGGDGGI